MGRRKICNHWIKSEDNTIKSLLGKHRLTHKLTISGEGGLAKEMDLSYPYLCKVINGRLGTSREIASQLVRILRKRLRIKLSLKDCFKKVQNAGQEAKK